MGHDSEQQRGSVAGGDIGCKVQEVDESEEGCGNVSGQEVGAGYVDIPRRVAWERLGSGRRNQASQVGPKRTRQHASTLGCILTSSRRDTTCFMFVRQDKDSMAVLAV